jgi:hypothetical protein
MTELKAIPRDVQLCDGNTQIYPHLAKMRDGEGSQLQQNFQRVQPHHNLPSSGTRLRNHPLEYCNNLLPLCPKIAHPVTRYKHFALRKYSPPPWS